MKGYQHWQDIAFLPVIHSLIEEDVRSLKNAYRGVFNKSTLEGWQELFQSWQAIPHKNDRQIQWLSDIEEGLFSLRKASAND